MFDLMPFRKNENSLFRYMDELEKNFFGDFISSPSGFSQFRTDIVDKDDHYLLKADLPGFNKEDIQIDLSNDILTIKAEHKEEKEEKEENYVRRERRFGSFSRSFNVKGIDAEKITAAYNEGVLHLNLPKVSETVPPSRQITID